jgi:hypothetical protein
MNTLNLIILCCCAIQVAICLTCVGRRRLNIGWLILASLAGLIGFVCALWVVIGQVTP